jgi:hypothetical protein
LLGAPPRFGEIAVRIAEHTLWPVVVVLDGDLGRHLRSLSHDLSVSWHAAAVNGPFVTYAATAIIIAYP